MYEDARKLGLNETTAILPAGTDILMTSRESAVYARRCSAKGQISRQWRGILRALVEQGLAYKQGNSPFGDILVRRSVVDDVIEGKIQV